MTDQEKIDLLHTEVDDLRKRLADAENRLAQTMVANALLNEWCSRYVHEIQDMRAAFSSEWEIVNEDEETILIETDADTHPYKCAYLSGHWLGIQEGDTEEETVELTVRWPDNFQLRKRGK